MTLLTESELSGLYLLAAVGVTFLFPLFVNPDNNLHRTLVVSVGAFLGVRYIIWRASETLAPFGLTLDCLASWSFFALEVANILSAFSVFAMMSRIKQRHKEADENAGWWAPSTAPKVVVLIATYNEDKDVLERTLVGAAALDYQNYEIWVLDDGRRDWLKELAQSYGARHITRGDNAHAKAGNINHALGLLAQEETRPDFVAILDADFVPHRNFISRAISLFHEDDVALVQTPQHFFNPDPVQQNLGLRRKYPDEQRFFFHQLMPARDAWDIAFCCGTSSMARFDALEEIGNFPTTSVTEDFLLSLALRERGYRTVYLDEPLTEGLAPEGISEYMTQRSRWCLGQMQIFRGEFGPFSRRKMRLRDRWSVMDAFLNWTACYSFRIAAFVFPLLYWYFDIIVVNAKVYDVVNYFAPFFVYAMLSLSYLSRGLVVPIIYDVAQTLGAFPITRAAYTGLLRPKGHAFKVTAKGGDRSQTIVQWRLMRPFVVLLVLTIVGLLIGIVSWYFRFTDAGDGKVVTLFWTIYNLAILTLTILVCIELPRSDRSVTDKPEKVTVRVGEDHPVTVWMRGLTTRDLRLRGLEAPKDASVLLAIDGVGHVSGEVVASQPGNTIVKIHPDEATHAAILRRLHAEGGAPNVEKPHIFGLIGDFLVRLATGRA